MILDLGLQLAAIVAGDLPAEDDGDLVGPADGAVGIEQAFAERVQRGPPVKDQIVAILDLGEEQPVPAAGVFALPRGEEGSERSQPLLPTAQQILRCQRVGEFLKTCEVAASEDRIRAFFKADTFSASRFASQWC